MLYNSCSSRSCLETFLKLSFNSLRLKSLSTTWRIKESWAIQKKRKVFRKGDSVLFYRNKRVQFWECNPFSHPPLRFYIYSLPFATLLHIDEIMNNWVSACRKGSHTNNSKTFWLRIRKTSKYKTTRNLFHLFIAVYTINWRGSDIMLDISILNCEHSIYQSTWKDK